VALGTSGERDQVPAPVDDRRIVLTGPGNHRPATQNYDHTAESNHNSFHGRILPTGAVFLRSVTLRNS
jgi:hypothetical protein